MAIELSDELVQLERAAWAEQQAGALTVATAAAVHARIAELADGDPHKRLQLEEAVKRHVRYGA